MKKTIVSIILLASVLQFASCGLIPVNRQEEKPAETKLIIINRYGSFDSETSTDEIHETAATRLETDRITDAPETETTSHKHSYDNGKTTVNPTCDKTGKKIFTCTVCGETKSETIPALDHKYQVTSEIPATCTYAGSTTYKCTLCGKSRTEKINATGHNYKNAGFDKPTCTAGGTNYFSCTKCGDSYSETVSASGHKWSNATCTEPKKCTRCGEESGSPAGHQDNGSGTCSRCGKSLEIDMRTRVSAPDNTFLFKTYSGWVDLEWNATNNSGKTIKYFTLTVKLYNSVDDLLTTYTSKRVSGPINPGETFGRSGSIMGYYCDIEQTVKVEISQIKLEYTDGTVEYGNYGYYAGKPEKWSWSAAATQF